MLLIVMFSPVWAVGVMSPSVTIIVFPLIFLRDLVAKYVLLFSPGIIEFSSITFSILKILDVIIDGVSLIIACYYAFLKSQLTITFGFIVAFWCLCGVPYLFVTNTWIEWIKYKKEKYVLSVEGSGGCGGGGVAVSVKSS